MKRIPTLIIAIIFSAIFTVALIYATFEIPHVIDSLLREEFIDAPDWQRFIDLKPIGYVLFLTTWVLILVGFVTSRLKLARLGSIFSFLPTFGYFATYMFFLRELESRGFFGFHFSTYPQTFLDWEMSCTCRIFSWSFSQHLSRRLIIPFPHGQATHCHL